MSGSQETLSLNEFLYCYRHVRVPKVKGMYYFKCRKEERKLVTEVPVHTIFVKDKSHDHEIV